MHIRNSDVDTLKFVDNSFPVFCSLKFKVRVCKGLLIIPIKFKNGKEYFRLRNQRSLWNTVHIFFNLVLLLIF
jgi:hypothetical protein